MKGRQWRQFFWIFSKAFDSVLHGILLDKLPSCGMSGFTMCWVGSRAQTVVVNGASSDWWHSALPFLRVQLQDQSCSMYLSMSWMQDAGYTIGNFIDDTKPGGVTYFLEGKEIAQIFIRDAQTWHKEAFLYQECGQRLQQVSCCVGWCPKPVSV